MNNATFLHGLASALMVLLLASCGHKSASKQELCGVKWDMDEQRFHGITGNWMRDHSGGGMPQMGSMRLEDDGINPKFNHGELQGYTISFAAFGSSRPLNRKQTDSIGKELNMVIHEIEKLYGHTTILTSTDEALANDGIHKLALWQGTDAVVTMWMDTQPFEQGKGHRARIDVQRKKMR